MKLTKEQSMYVVVVAFLTMIGMLMTLTSMHHESILLKRLGLMVFLGFLFNQTFHCIRWHGANKKLLYAIGFTALAVFVVVIIMPFQ